MSKYTLSFYAKRTKTAGIVGIYGRITVQGKRTEISTGYRIASTAWNSNTGKMKGNSAEAKSINNSLELMRLRVLQDYNDMLLRGEAITTESLKNRFLGISEKQMNILEVFRDHNAQMSKLQGKQFAAGTMKRYETSLRHTQAFIKWKYKRTDLPVSAVDPAFISQYDFWFRTVRNCSNNTTVKYLKNFQKIINICLTNGWLEKNPFIGHKTRLEAVETKYLEQEALQRIIDKEFRSERLSLVRDIFLFSCFTGLAYTDIKKLTRQQILKGMDGEWWISTERQKTNTVVKLPLLPAAQTILDKYQHHPKCLNAGFCLPILSNQKMNEYLKEISTLCDLDIDLTFHAARHTFATTVTLANGVPLETVSKMLGHTSVRMTQHYARILDSKISEDMAILKQKVNYAPAKKQA